MAWWNLKKENKEIEVKEESNYFEGYAPNKPWNPVYTDFYDGEKTPGELGAVLDTMPEFEKLRLRSLDATLKTDIIRIITGKFFKGVIGSGLKLQAEPVDTILKLNGINVDLTDFKKNTEAYFNLYAESNFSDYSKMQNLHDKANECFRDSFLGGDSLQILRVDEFGVNAQVIDGGQVKQPSAEHNVLEKKKENNTVIDGVEIDEKGQHVAYYVETSDNDDFIPEFEFERIECRDSKGREVARMVYGDKHRINHVRGIPRTTAILEKINKMDRFTEATVGKMEESANVVLSIKHSKDSTGETPLAPGVSKVGAGSNKTAEDVYEQGQRTAANIQQSTSKKTYNMPIGSELVGFESGVNSAEYSDFSKTVFMYLCASIEIPVEVALQAYNSNYSASRAAINAWEQILLIVRNKFARDFYNPFYRMYLDYMILSEKIEAPGYLKALNNNDFMVIEAYSKSRWIGQKVPHIDPLKEVKAVELMIQLKLISREQGAEMLNLGTWEENYKKFEEEGKILPQEKEENNNNE